MDSMAKVIIMIHESLVFNNKKMNKNRRRKILHNRPTGGLASSTRNMAELADANFECGCRCVV